MNGGDNYNKDNYNQYNNKDNNKEIAMNNNQDNNNDQLLTQLMSIDASKVIRQGDVNLMPVEAIPPAAKPQDTKVLQPSETHGKFHRFKEDAPITIYETLEAPAPGTITPDLGKFVVVDEDTILFHGKGYDILPNTKTSTDHGAIPIPAGNYQVIILYEYDHDKKQAAPVRD